MKDRDLNHPPWIDQFRNLTIDKVQRRGNQKYNNNKLVETSSNQLPQQGFDTDMTRVSHIFYREVTYDKQLQAYVFTDNNAPVPVESGMYIIFHEPTRTNFRCNQKLGNLGKLG